MFDTFPRLTGLFDPVAGRRAFSELHVREHVLDAGERTIVVREIASVSVGVDDRWPIKIVLLALACVVAAVAVFFVWAAIFAVLLVVSAVFVKSTSTLAIATNDGSRTFFSCDARADLDEALAFLTEKLNTEDAEMTRRFRFGGDRLARSSSVAAATAAVDAATDTAAEAAAGSAGATEADTAVAAPAPSSAPNQIDYDPVIAQVMELHRFYAKTPNTKHIEDRLSEMEALMRSGTPDKNDRERMRQLAGELASIMQAYPPMVQLFQHIAELATPTRSAAA